VGVTVSCGSRSHAGQMHLGFQSPGKAAIYSFPKESWEGALCVPFLMQLLACSRRVNGHSQFLSLA
jgi:hypothetical protein